MTKPFVRPQKERELRSSPVGSSSRCAAGSPMPVCRAVCAAHEIRTQRVPARAGAVPLVTLDTATASSRSARAPGHHASAEVPVFPDRPTTCKQDKIMHTICVPRPLCVSRCRPKTRPCPRRWCTSQQSLTFAAAARCCSQVQSPPVQVVWIASHHGRDRSDVSRVAAGTGWTRMRAHGGCLLISGPWATS